MVSSTKSLVLGAVWLSSMGALADSNFNWDALRPSTKLDWKPCYSGFECTRLIVPLDYDSTAGANAAIAITRYPSTSSKSDYLGPILLNPGGPGGSGVDYVVEAGEQISTILGDRFDLVGFDPRGVSYSTPTVSWFKSDAERALWIPSTQSTVYPSLNESEYAVAQQWARAQIQGQLAQERAGGYLQYITTDNTARDMLRITEAFGQEKLQYWGISYGSVLGSTFAAMFPDKVGRVVIDGVLDMDAWYSANLTTEEVDTDKALQAFTDGCFAAGPDNCAFYAPSSAQITANLQALLDSAKTNPLPVVTPISYDVFGYTLLKNAIFDSLYSPSSLFQILAEGLADLAMGNASTIYNGFIEAPPFECAAGSNTSSPQIPFHENGFEAAVSIACSDAVEVNDNISQLQQFYFEAQKVSSFGDLWSNWRVVCSGWKAHREGRFAGPFGAANTSFPLLVIGNTVDPVTPISGAIKTVQAFPGSVLLTLDAVGHTSINAPSTCVYGYLRQYFVNGTLPEVGTVCTPDSPLFPSSADNSTTLGRRTLNPGAKLSRAGRGIAAARRRVTRH
ncbi:TAP-like protein-domain-containing protein [Mycena metata]|uniref:TAP-like protein-domain-containing protein n=1 Tax=Mycena metata TaxID=1033252 RepID=A0AAD7NT27_9AGAR|nr:TAP-like protein-domain-containing protein [Mycena metata]